MINPYKGNIAAVDVGLFNTQGYRGFPASSYSERRYPDEDPRQFELRGSVDFGKIGLQLQYFNTELILMVRVSELPLSAKASISHLSSHYQDNHKPLKPRF